MKLRDVYGSYQPFGEKLLPTEKPPRPEPEIGEVDGIISTWRHVLGIELNPEIVIKHLETLRRWQRRRVT